MALTTATTGSFAGSYTLSLSDEDLPGAGAGHSWVTQNFGNACDANATPYINDCEYDQAGDILRTLYGPLQPKAAAPAGRIVAFNQTEFVPGGAAAANGMLDTGYLYVPKACEPGAAQPCRLHVALHGCLQSAEKLGDEFYTKIGLNEWADTNAMRRPWRSWQSRTACRRSTPLRRAAGTGGGMPSTRSS